MQLPKRIPLYLSIAVIVGYWAYQLAISNHTIPTQFSDFAYQIARTKIIHLLAVLFLLNLEGSGFKQLGFTTNHWIRQVLIGLLMGAIMFVLLNAGLNSILGSLFPKPADSGTSLMSYFTDIRNLYLWLLIGIFGGGFVEELMRIFILTRFEKAFDKPGLYAALICSSAVFGFGHLYQGVGTAIATGVSGLVFGIVFIRRRSAIELITMHAFADVLSIIAAYGLAGH